MFLSVLECFLSGCVECFVVFLSVFLVFLSGLVRFSVFFVGLVCF